MLQIREARKKAILYLYHKFTGCLIATKQVFTSHRGTHGNVPPIMHREEEDSLCCITTKYIYRERGRWRNREIDRYQCICIYIHVYRERQRESVHIHIYIYIQWDLNKE